MKKIFFVLLAGTVLVGAFAFTSLKKYTDIFRQLKIENSEAREAIFLNFENGNLGFPHSSVITKLAVGQRESAVKEIGDYIKAYTNSPAFAEQYKAAREAAKPEGPSSADEKIKARITTIEDDITLTQEELKKTTGDMKKLYEASLTELKKELNILQNPADPNYQYYRKKVTKMKDGEADMSGSDLKDWERDYPVTVKELVKRRLVEFLELTKDIDFGARLVKSGNKMIFADPAMEEKDALWKSCFRCGKETIGAARKYAQEWLATIK